MNIVIIILSAIGACAIVFTGLVVAAAIFGGRSDAHLETLAQELADLERIPVLPYDPEGLR